jgi:histone arginine demethylase JMJD6
MNLLDASPPFTVPFAPVNSRLTKGNPIERRNQLSPGEFQAEYAMKHKPVILTGVLDHWSALGKWTPEFFAAEYPEKLLKFKYGALEMKMKDFIPLVMESTPAKPAPYWTNNVVEDYFPGLMPGITPLPPHTVPNWAARRFLHSGMSAGLNRGAKVEIYIGGPGGAFPVLHWDGMSTHAFLMQLHGLKQYWVWPPDDQPLMYPKEGAEWNLSRIRDVENPDLEKYPLFAEARCTTFVLEPGEMLFVPSRWWHTARMLTPSTTLSVNTLNQSNWSNFCDDLTSRASGPARLLKRAYLALEHARFTRL